MNAVPAEPLLAAVKFDADGLVPVIAQEAATGMVRMSPILWAVRKSNAVPATSVIVPSGTPLAAGGVYLSA